MKELRAPLLLLRMRRNLHVSPEALRNEQTRQLRETVQHAYSTTQYYRNLLDAAGIHPRDIRTLSDLPRIPISTKEDLLRIPLEDRVAKGTNLRKCLKVRSSGTTGTPWNVFISSSEKLRRVLADVRALLANGYHFFDKTCILRGPAELPGPHHWFQHLGLLRRRYFWLLDDIESKLPILTEGNYDIIYGFPSDLFLLAEAMLERGIAPTPPKMVVTNGELVQPQWQRIIHQAFRRDPTDFYGSIEFGYIAWQCPERQGYHVNADLFVLELVKDGTVVGTGEEGEVVITDLAPRAMPLIRFVTGDWACSADAACPCGITLPTLSHISGRLQDFLFLPSGKKIAPHWITDKMEGVTAIKSYQVVQVSRTDVAVRYTRHSDASEDPFPMIVKALRPVIGEAMQLHLREVASIARPSGKFRLVENALLSTR